MALQPDQKFSTFAVGGNPTTGDLIVGLRGGINTKFTWNGSSSGVSTVTGTQFQVLVNNSFGAPVTGDLILTLPQDIAPTSSPTFANLTLTGADIFDLNGNPILHFTPISSAVNYVDIANAATSTGPVIKAIGSDANIALGISSKGTGILALTAANISNQIQIYTYTGGACENVFNFTGTSGTNIYTFQNASGTLAFLSDIPGAGVTSITGTALQVIASSPTGAVTLSLPQNIAPTSSPTFAGLTLTSPLTGANGGTGINNGIKTIDLSAFTTGYVLTSDASGNATWQPNPGGGGDITTINADSGSATPTAGVVTISGGSTGLTTLGSASTVTLLGILAPANGGTGINNGSNTLAVSANSLINQDVRTTGTPTFASVTFLPDTQGIVGVTSGSTGGAGYVGQIISASVPFASRITLITGTLTNLTSIVLPAGSWSISGSVYFNTTSASNVFYLAGLSTTSVTLPDLSNTYQLTQNITLLADQSGSALPLMILNISSPTTVYNVVEYTAIAGTITCSGSITAIRIR